MKYGIIIILSILFAYGCSYTISRGVRETSIKQSEMNNRAFTLRNKIAHNKKYLSVLYKIKNNYEIDIKKWSDLKNAKKANAHEYYDIYNKYLELSEIIRKIELETIEFSSQLDHYSRFEK